MAGLTEPVSQDESALLGEATIIKDKQELCAIGAQALQAVGHAAGKVPQVTLLEVLDEVAALVVEGSDTNRAIEDVGPLGLLVPVQLANDALAQAHVDGGQLAGGGQLADGGLAGPSSFLRVGASIVSFYAHLGMGRKQLIERGQDVLRSSRGSLRNSSACWPCCRDQCWVA